ncbi:hypothetical protein L1049_020953 [Liquidambar formosana]|uniref:Protein kinase domain-containing protein n=1 Tax=Liquidambar formosana TaxID=63359 RepID=A0AAP0S8R9_LIQFO
MGTYGYCAPEYVMTSQLTLKSNVYNFGVVLLEIITGRKAIDNSKAAGEHNLVTRDAYDLRASSGSTPSKHEWSQTNCRSSPLLLLKP